ncbi:MAG: flagellar biosynthesis protein FlhB [Phycisphaerae bacterium]|nr:flagellar biosynthesis protein FlhB [Phycisphaerae bacterium]
MPEHESGGDKTERPTPRRREEARQEGNVARSQDLSSAFLRLGGVLLLWAFGGAALHTMKSMVAAMISEPLGPDALRPTQIGFLGTWGVELAVRILLPLAGGLFLLGLVGGVGQVGFVFSSRPLMPRLSKISPIAGFKRLFSLRSVMRMLMSVLKIGVVLAVATLALRSDLPRILALVRLDPAALLAAASWLVFSLAIKLGAVLLILGLLDFAYQKWQHEQELKMTKQEVKDELKRMEGDPLVKQRRAKVARQLALHRLAVDVPTADVVVTNPTHFAVALKYDGAEMTAPRVVAKGGDFMAHRIRHLAMVHQVPLVERPPLARALYRQVEVGQEIPAEFFAAVAEILAYVYRLSGKRSA